MKAKKIISLALCAVMLVALSIAGTLAYLTSQDSAVNTFTVGKVEIDLKETNVTNPANKTDTGNAYHLLPGQTHVKDPKVTVLEGSEDCWVRMLVTVSDIEKLKAAMPKGDFPTFYADDLFLLQNLTADENGVLTWDTDWEYYVNGYKQATDPETNKITATYEFRYKNIVGPSSNIPELFTHITVPGEVDETQMLSLQGMKITVVAHAIQAAGFADADAAWAAFGTQNP